jgi:predicted MFS family arabinose efflux permease
MAMYANNIGLTTDTGLFFTIMAFGLIVSRLFSGKRVDKGYITSTIRNGMFIAFWGVLGEALLSFFADYDITVAYVVYFVSALFIGYGFGTMFPAFNTLFVNLAPNSRRATATATYLTGWDVGIGMGMLLGGALGNGSFALSFTMGTLLVVLSTLFFIFYAAPHFNKNRLR